MNEKPTIHYSAFGPTIDRLTIRDQFMMAVAGQLALLEAKGELQDLNADEDWTPAQRVACQSYAIADAMLAERAKKP